MSERPRRIEITDPVYVLRFLFTSGKEPPAPYPACGPDGGQDSLFCASFTPCP